MSLVDTNIPVRAFLAADTGVNAIAGERVYVGRLPKDAALPAVSLFTRPGGSSTPYIPDLATPSKQIDCWARDVEVAGVAASGLIIARRLYRAVHDALQGIQNRSITVDGTTYHILSAREEIPGQDLLDLDVEGYFRVLTFYEFIIW